VVTLDGHLKEAEERFLVPFLRQLPQPVSALIDSLTRDKQFQKTFEPILEDKQTMSTLDSAVGLVMAVVDLASAHSPQKASHAVEEKGTGTRPMFFLTRLDSALLHMLLVAVMMVVSQFFLSIFCSGNYGNFHPEICKNMDIFWLPKLLPEENEMAEKNRAAEMKELQHSLTRFYVG